MRHIHSRNEHGVCRVVSPTGDIYEYTFKDGKGHGLQRWIYQHQVQVLLFKDGDFLSYFYFDKRFKETVRHDPVHYIDDLTPESFNKELVEPKTPVIEVNEDDWSD